jgi:hypothetical protein
VETETEFVPPSYNPAWANERGSVS